MELRAARGTRDVALLVCVLLGGCGGEPPLAIASPRVYDVGPGLPLPAFALALVYENRGAESIPAPRRLSLFVRSIRTGGRLEIEAEVFDADATELAIGPGERREVVYDLWRLANVFRSGSFPELRSAPETLRFRVSVEVDEREVESAEWSGVIADDQAALELLGAEELEL